jgi:SseB protein C-terminal domain
MTESKTPRPPQQIVVRSIDFVGEQDGPPERELKEKLTVLFGQLQLVRTAYLALVRYDNAGPLHVALCIRGQPGQHRMFAQRVNQVFSAMFGSHEHLDTIWLTPDQEISLRQVCRAFYDRKTASE